MGSESVSDHYAVLFWLLETWKIFREWGQGGVVIRLGLEGGGVLYNLATAICAKTFIQYITAISSLQVF